jgi:hypothetical protein
MELFGNIGFFVVGFILWGLIIVSALSFLWGLWKRSRNAFLTSGITILVPAVVLSTQKGMFLLFLALPVLAFVLAYFTKK